MENTLELGNQSRGTNLMTIETDFSLCTLRQLFKARYWVDAKCDSDRIRYLEKEIQKRCAFIRERINGTPSAAPEWGTRFRPYGFITGVVFLSCSIGPFAAVKFLDLINVIHDVHGDQLTLSGVWAILTLPFAVLTFMIGGIMDAGRVVQWLELTGRQEPQTKPASDLFFDHQSPADTILDRVEPACPIGTQVGSEPIRKRSRRSTKRHEPLGAVKQPKPGSPSRVGAEPVE
jgi:hypothetical protein